MVIATPCQIFGRPEIPVDHHYDSSVVAVPSTEFLPAVKMPQLFKPLPPHFLAALEEEYPTDSYGAPLKPDYGPPKTDYGPPKPEYGPPKPEYGPPTPVYGPPNTLQQLVTKNIYVHLPPPDYDEPQPQQIFEPPAPKKHYKIIFIKAPAPPKQVAPKLPQPVEDEHKTLVYVLVKKPDPQAQIEVPKPKPTQPSKPEVYFIKYKEGEKPQTQYGPPPGPY